MEILIVMLFIYALFVYWTVKIAEKNGRSKWLAFFWGLMLGIWAVIIYAIMGKSEIKIREEESARMKEMATMVKDMKNS